MGMSSRVSLAITAFISFSVLAIDSCSPSATRPGPVPAGWTTPLGRLQPTPSSLPLGGGLSLFWSYQPLRGPPPRWTSLRVLACAYSCGPLKHTGQYNVKANYLVKPHFL